MLTITIPTTGRRERLKECLRSIDYDSIIHIGAKAESDVDISEFKEKRILVFYSNVPIVRFQNMLAPIREDSHVLPIADDIEFRPGAIAAAVEALHEKFPDGDGVVGLNAVNMSEKDKRPYSFLLIGSKYLNTRLAGKPFYDGYHHFYADIEAGMSAQKIGRFFFCEAAGLIHHHPSSGSLPDRTHLYKRQEKWAHDYALFNERNREGWYARFPLRETA